MRKGSDMQQYPPDQPPYYPYMPPRVPPPEPESEPPKPWYKRLRDWWDARDPFLKVGSGCGTLLLIFALCGITNSFAHVAPVPRLIPQAPAPKKEAPAVSPHVLPTATPGITPQASSTPSVTPTATVTPVATTTPTATVTPGATGTPDTFAPPPQASP